MKSAHRLSSLYSVRNCASSVCRQTAPIRQAQRVVAEANHQECRLIAFTHQEQQVASDLFAQLLVGHALAQPLCPTVINVQRSEALSRITSQPTLTCARHATRRAASSSSSARLLAQPVDLCVERQEGQCIRAVQSHSQEGLSSLIIVVTCAFTASGA